MTDIQIPLRNRKGEIVGVTVIDAVDADLAKLRWHRSSSGYAKRAVKTAGKIEFFFLHVVIAERAGIDTSGEVDHRDTDSLNNRRGNLRPATHAENGRNTGRYRTNTSGFKGVSWDKSAGRWKATIKVDGKKFSLGNFADPKDAAEAYAVAARKFHGEFARTA